MDGTGLGVASESHARFTQEQVWRVIDSFFEDKELVSQQIDSFDEFVQNAMQNIVDENSVLTLQTSPQYTGAADDFTRRFEIKFGQVYLSRPSVEDNHGIHILFPQEARMRNLTYGNLARELNNNAIAAIQHHF